MTHGHELDRLIRDARGAEAPSSAQREHVREALAQRISRGDGTPDIDGPSRSPSVARAGLGAGGILSAGVGLVVGACVAYAVTRGISAEPPRAAAGLASRARAPVSSQPPVSSQRSGPLSPGPSLEPASRAPALSEPAQHRPALPEPAQRRPRPGEPPASRAARRIGDAQRDTPTHQKNPGATVDEAGPAGALSESNTARRRIDGDAERRALARVQRALRDARFTEALAALDADDQTYAGGALVEEREAARVLARCGSGDAPGARRLAAAFAARHPSSPLRPRVLASCTAPAEGSSR